MNSVLQDVRYGARMLRTNPVFTLIAVLTLALGIGAASAIFGIINTVLIRPLPYPQADRLVWAWGTFTGGNQAAISIPDFVDYRSENKSFEELAAFLDQVSFNLAGDQSPEQVEGAVVSYNFFRALSIQPEIGREFLPEEEKESEPQVVILSYALWERRFGGDQSIIGTRINMDARSVTVVGVMPRGFDFPAGAQVLAPIPLDARWGRLRQAHALRVVARLKQGVSLQQAKVGISLVADQLAAAYPDTNKGWGIRLQSLQDVLVGNARPALLVLFAAVAFVLLIACANIANLLLARAASRHREFAIRTALGAGSLRVIRQLLTESLLLAAAGGCLGVLLSVWGVGLASSAAAKVTGLNLSVEIDRNVLCFSAGITLLTGILFGLAPALKAARLELNESLKEGKGTGGIHAGGGRTLSCLVVSEVALSLVLLIGAGLMTRSFIRLMRDDPGFNSSGLLTMQVSLPASTYPDKAKVASFFQQLLQKVKVLPGVKAAGLISELPMSGQMNDLHFAVEGRPPVERSQRPVAYWRRASSDYFEVMGIPLVAGRYFTEQEASESSSAVIISKQFAESVFPGEDPIGKRLTIGVDNPQVSQIVGIVGDVKDVALRESAFREMYVPSLDVGRMNVVIRSDVNPLSLAAAVRAQVWAIDKDQPVSNISAMDDLVKSSAAQQWINTVLLAVFAGAALILGGFGLYGVISYSVAQRTHEIGIRMALGATRRDVVLIIGKRGMRLTAIGVVIGLAAALALTRAMSGLLFGISTTDAATFVGVPVILGSVALLACYVPALKATATDPVEALRCE